MAAALLALASAGRPAWAQNAGGAAEPSLRCAVDAAIGLPGRALLLQAWAADAAGTPIELPAGLRWRVPLGVVSVQPALPGAARWQLPARWDTTLRRADAVLLDAESRELCRSELLLARESDTRALRPPDDPTRGPIRSHRFLVPGEPEPRGHPALAWLLLPQPPADAERERHLAVLMAVLRQLPAATDLEALLPAAAVVPLLLPLRYRPQLPLEPARAGDAALRSAAQQLLEAYDHVRARALLQAMDLAAEGSGPLLASRVLPAAGQPAGQLLQDFSAVDDRVATAWAHWALRLGTDPRSAQPERLTQIGLTLRNIVAHAARAMPDVGQRAPQWVRVAQLPAR